MIPTGSTIQNGAIQERVMPSHTWKIDFDKGKVVGMTDGLDAVRQAVYCTLETDRFRHLIYSFDYGNELKKCIGMNRDYVESEVKRYLNEALLEDDRITAIENIQMETRGDQMTVNFTVITDIGSFNEGVTLSV